MTSSIDSRLHALMNGAGENNFPFKMAPAPVATKRPHDEQTSPSAGGSEENKRLKGMVDVLKDSLSKERAKNEQLIAEVRAVKLAAAKDKQAASLTTKELASVRQELVSSKEALISFAIRARQDREECVSNAKHEKKEERSEENVPIPPPQIQNDFDVNSLFVDDNDYDD